MLSRNRFKITEILDLRLELPEYVEAKKWRYDSTTGRLVKKINWLAELSNDMRTYIVSFLSGRECWRLLPSKWCTKEEMEKYVSHHQPHGIVENFDVNLIERYIKPQVKIWHLSSVINYWEGYLHGLSTHYHMSMKREGDKRGRVKSKCTYFLGKIHGVHITSSFKGGLIESTTYVHGVRKGMYVKYHLNGQPHIVGSLDTISGNRIWVGDKMSYSRDGHLVHHEKFNTEGRKDGIQIRYSNNFDFEKVVLGYIWYDNGVAHGPAMENNFPTFNLGGKFICNAHLTPGYTYIHDCWLDPYNPKYKNYRGMYPELYDVRPDYTCIPDCWLDPTSDRYIRHERNGYLKYILVPLQPGTW